MKIFKRNMADFFICIICAIGRCFRPRGGFMWTDCKKKFFLEMDIRYRDWRLKYDD